MNVENLKKESKGYCNNMVYNKMNTKGTSTSWKFQLPIKFSN